MGTTARPKLSCILKNLNKTKTMSLVRQINAMKKAAPPAPPAPTPQDVLLLRQIRDSLNK